MRRKLGLRVLSNNSQSLRLVVLLRAALRSFRTFLVPKRRIHRPRLINDGVLLEFRKISSQARIGGRTPLATRAANKEGTLLPRRLKEVVTSKYSP